jgi:hypothetical protein
MYYINSTCIACIYWHHPNTACFIIITLNKYHAPVFSPPVRVVFICMLRCSCVSLSVRYLFVGFRLLTDFFSVRCVEFTLLWVRSRFAVCVASLSHPLFCLLRFQGSDDGDLDTDTDASADASDDAADYADTDTDASADASDDAVDYAPTEDPAKPLKSKRTKNEEVPPEGELP